MSNQRQKNNTQAKDAKQASAQKPAASPPNKRSSAASSAAEKHQTPAPTAAKPSAANTDSTSTSNTDSTTDSSLNNDMSRKNQKNTSAKNTPNTATKAAGHNADNQQDKAEQTNTNQPGDKNKEKANTNADKTNKADKPTKVNADTNTGAAEKKPDKKADNDHAVPAKKDHQPSPTPPPAAKNDKSGTGLVAKLALLLGVLGTVIAAYDYNEIRTLKSQNHSAELVAKLDAAEAKIAELSARNTDALEAKVTALANDAAALKTTGGRVNERLSAIEQTQNGLTKTLQGDLNATLDARLNEINALLKKVEQIEMTQEGLAQNLNQVTAAGEAVTAEGMARQEVGYLLRMADYKIDSEGDTVGAMGLLKIAEDKLLLLNQGQSDNLINAIRQKNIQLAGVKPVDPNAIISDLRAISRQVPNLIAKANAVPVVLNTPRTTPVKLIFRQKPC